MENRVRRSFAGSVSVREIAQIKEGIFRLILGKGMRFQPGQFLTICCGEDTISPRPFSILSSDPTRTEIWFKVKGRGTAWLAQRKPIDYLYVAGPSGNYFTSEARSEHLLFLAGGMGIVPILSFVMRLLRDPTSPQITLLYGAKNEEELIEAPDFSKIDNLHPMTEDGSVGQQGLVTDLLPAISDKTDQIFACGPKEMLAKVAEIIGPSEIPCQIALETVMGCGGQGRCFGCAVPTFGGYFLLCQDGPVFNLKEVKLK